MPGKQFSFFATQDDLIEVMEAVASKAFYRFVRIDDIKDGTPNICESIADLDDFSIAISGDQNREKSYLLIAADAKPKTRQVELRKGGINYVMDQGSHPESVFFSSGGVFKEFECIIAGQIGTISDDKWSTNLYKVLFAELKKRFKKIKSFYVGRIAEKKLDEGVRLTSSIKAPPEYDLQK